MGKIKKVLTVFLPVMLLANMLVSPFLSVANANALSMEAEAAAYIEAGRPATISPLAVTSGHVGGFLGLDTLWNGIKSFFNALYQIIQGIIEVAMCVGDWASAGGILGALLACPFIVILKNAITMLTNIMDGMFMVRIFDTSPNNQALVTGLQEATNQFIIMANIIFVIVLLIAIISMVTSIGISNYHIKKLAPKIGIVAVLVNLSFYICVLLTDVSNISGYAAKGIFDSIALRVVQKDVTVNGQNAAGNNVVLHTGICDGGASTCPDYRTYLTRLEETVGSSGLTADQKTALGTDAATMGIIMAIMLAVIAIMVIIAGVVLPILASLRILLLVVLIIVSPIAFVLILHPKGQKYFISWFKNFTGMLFIFPVFACIVGFSEICTALFSMMQIGTSADGFEVFMPKFILQIAGMWLAMAAPILFIKPIMNKMAPMLKSMGDTLGSGIKGAAMIGAAAITGGAAGGLMGAAKGAMGSAAPGLSKFGSDFKAARGEGKANKQAKRIAKGKDPSGFIGSKINKAKAAAGGRLNKINDAVRSRMDRRIAANPGKKNVLAKITRGASGKVIGGAGVGMSKSALMAGVPGQMTASAAVAEARKATDVAIGNIQDIQGGQTKDDQLRSILSNPAKDAQTIAMKQSALAELGGGLANSAAMAYVESNPGASADQLIENMVATGAPKMSNSQLVQDHKAAELISSYDSKAIPMPLATATPAEVAAATATANAINAAKTKKAAVTRAWGDGSDAARNLRNNATESARGKLGLS
jgi:hypothetical protein